MKSSLVTLLLVAVLVLFQSEYVWSLGNCAQINFYYLENGEKNELKSNQFSVKQGGFLWWHRCKLKTCIANVIFRFSLR